MTANSRCGNGSAASTNASKRQAVGHESGLASDGGEEAIIVLIIVADSSSPQSRGDGPPPAEQTTSPTTSPTTTPAAASDYARAARPPTTRSNATTAAAIPSDIATSPSLALLSRGVLDNRSVMEEPFFTERQLWQGFRKVPIDILSAPLDRSL
jgi:hypothetical protein